MKESHYKPTCALIKQRKEKYDVATEPSLSNLVSCVFKLLIYQEAIRIPKEQYRYVWYVIIH